MQILRSLQAEQLKANESILHDARRKYNLELDDMRRGHEDEMNTKTRKHEDEMLVVRQKVETELNCIRKDKDEETASMHQQNRADAQAAAAQHETEMSALRAQWESQMLDLRRQHEVHVKVAIAKDMIVEELERVRNALARRDDEMQQLQRSFDEDRRIMFEDRMKKDEDLSQTRQEIREREWGSAKQQEELVMLRGTVRRTEDEDKRRAEEMNQLSGSIAAKERDFQTLKEKNLSLLQEVRAKEDKITQLEENTNQHKDVRMLLQEHDAIVEKFRVEVLALHKENSRVNFAAEEMKDEVSRLREEIRNKVTDLHQMTNKFEMDIILFEKTLADQQAQFRTLEIRFLDYQRQAEYERATYLEESAGYKLAMQNQRQESEHVRAELLQIESLGKAQNAELEQARALLQGAEGLECDMSKQQEELVVLRGTNRRKDEEKLKLDIGTLPLPSSPSLISLLSCLPP